MATHSLLPLSLFLLFSLFLAHSWAVDMSIISYDEKHGLSNANDDLLTMYESWIVKHGKSYNALGEKEKRFQIFKENLRYIEEQNAAPGRTFKLGLNRFADLTNQEYQKMYLGTRPRAARRLSATKSDRYALRDGDSLPESVDWRQSGAVGPVKDQGSCGN